MNDGTSRNMILWFFLACFIISIFMMGWLLKPFFSIIILAAVLAGIFYPVFRFIRRVDKIGAPIASFLTCLLIFIIVFVPIVFFVGSLAQQAFELVQLAQNAVANDQVIELLQKSKVLDKINMLLVRFDYQVTGEELQRAIAEIGRVVGLFLFGQARGIAQNTFAFIINFFLMLMVIYFLLMDGERLIAFIFDISPLPEDQDRKLIQKFNEMAGAILVGNGLGGLIQGVLGGLAFWFLGLRSAFLWGVIMGLLAFLPIIGIGMVLFPTAIYLLLTGRIAAGIFVIVFYLVVSFGTEYIFKPNLVGQQVKMHPLLVFFSIIGGLKLLGILGIIYGPLVVTAFLTLAEIYQGNYRNLIEQKDT
ncbi:MAG: AI-2E family transporter [Desulfobacteraceae bacterium]|nr:AI-2E family transporter [Desulfobacteraceae bacterium]